MKKIGLLISLLTSTYFTLYSQSLKVGFDTDFSSKSIDIKDNFFDHQLNNSFTYGITAKISYELGKKISIISGLGYEQNKFKTEFNFRTGIEGNNDPIIPEETTKNITYINMPIQLVYKVSLSDKIFLSPSIGMNLGFLIASSEETTFGAGNSSETEYFFNDLNSLVYSLTFDIPVNYQLSEKISLHITPFIAKALNNIDNQGTESNLLNIHSENTFFQFGGRIGCMVKI